MTAVDWLSESVARFATTVWRVIDLPLIYQISYVGLVWNVRQQVRRVHGACANATVPTNFTPRRRNENKICDRDRERFRAHGCRYGSRGRLERPESQVRRAAKADGGGQGPARPGHEKAEGRAGEAGCCARGRRGRAFPEEKGG